MIWVVDASVAARWVLEDEAHPNADAVLERLVSSPGSFAVPELFAFEVFSVLARMHPEPLDAFTKGILPLLEGGILRYPMTRELAGAARKFLHLGLTGYDSSYAALATLVKGTWLTFDSKAHRRLARTNLSWDLSNGVPEGF